MVRWPPMLRRSRARICALVAATAFAGAPAAAAPERTRADKIYLEGRAAFDRGDYEKACPAFLAYFEADPSPAALFTLAECEARWGKPARALTHFETFVRISADAPASPVQEQRARMAYEHIAKLSALVGKVLPVVGPGVDGSAAIRLDGELVATPVTYPIVVEPGEHVLELSTGSGAHFEKRFTIAAGESRRIELDGAEAPTPPPPPPSRERGREIGLPVFAAGGVAGAGILVGSIFGALAWGQRSTIDAHCPGRVCDDEGRSSVDRGQGFATVSTIGFAIGLVGAAAAAVLYFTAPRSGS